MPRRYRAQLVKYSTQLTPTTLEALRALVPEGLRASFVDLAIRVALSREALIRGHGAAPGVQLEAIAGVLRDSADELARHAAKWGDPG